MEKMPIRLSKSNSFYMHRGSHPLKYCPTLVVPSFYIITSSLTRSGPPKTNTLYYLLNLLKTKQKASTDSLSIYYFLSSQPKTNRIVSTYIGLSFPGGSVIKNPPANAGNVGKIPWSREWQPTPAFLPGKSHGQRNLVDYSSWGRKESNTTKGLNKNNNSIHWLHTNVSHFTLALPLQPGQ